jgi:hypothetical protein
MFARGAVRMATVTGCICAGIGAQTDNSAESDKNKRVEFPFAEHPMKDNATAKRTQSVGRLSERPDFQSRQGPLNAQPRAKGQTSRPRKANAPSGLLTALFAVAVLCVLGYAWSLRAERHIDAGTGVGYWIGVIGSLMMLVLGLYPLRKKLKSMRGAGAVSTWFKSHMVLGILGPMLIILHSNFRLSAINNTFAMFAMLTVVASGLVARFLYSRLHYGLYGQKAELSALSKDAETFREAFGADIEHAPQIEAELKSAEQALFQTAKTARQSLKLLVGLKRSQRQWHDKVMTEVQSVMSATALREHWDAEVFDARMNAAAGHLEDFQTTLRKAAGLRFYERLFSLWHLLHMPLFFLLIVSALIHVIAVHLY